MPGMTLAEYDTIRADVKAAAQTAFVVALIAGDAEQASSLLEASQHGSLEADVLYTLGFDAEAVAIHGEP